MSHGDIIAIIGAILTLVAAAATVVAVKYARESARAARDTIQPLRDLAADMKKSVQAERDIATGMTLSVEAQREALEATHALIGATASTADTLQLLWREERVARTIRQLERVAEAVTDVHEAVYLGSPSHFHERIFALQTALSAFTPEELPKCLYLVEMPSLEDVRSEIASVRARQEVQDAMKRAHKELASLTQPEV